MKYLGPTIVNAPDIATKAYVDAAANPIPTSLKRLTCTFGSSNQPPLAIGTNQFTARVLNALNVTPTRYRFNISNANAQNGTNPATPMVLNTIWLGFPIYDDSSHSLKWVGNMSSPLQVYSGAGSLPTSGVTDLVTPWITNAGEITQRKPFVVSLGVTPSTGGSGVLMSDCYGGVQYGATSANQAGVGSPGSGFNYSGFMFDVRMEYEFNATTKDLVALIVGASGESGYTPSGGTTGTGTDRALNDPLDAWPSKWAAAQGYHVINAGLNGSALGDWVSGSGRPYSRFDLATSVPDVAVIGSMASNDISLGTAVSTIISNYNTVISVLRGLGISRIFGVTIPPRGLSGTNETNRGLFNAFMRGIPNGLENVFDFDIEIRNPASVAAMNPDLVSTDNIHPTREGAAVLANIPKIGDNAHGAAAAPSNSIVALTDASTIATDASLGSTFSVTLGGNRTLGAPTNPSDGMRRVWRIRQDATGTRTLTLATGTSGFVLGSQITNTVLATAANKVAYITAFYDSSYPGGARWCVLAFEPGV